MTSSATVLLSYIGWTMVMALLLVSHRGLFLLSGQRRIDGFSADNKGLGALGERLARVHANCVENLPVAGGLLLYGVISGQTSLTDPLAPTLLGLRIVQSLVHISGTRPWQVWLRLTCYLGQLAVCAYWLGRYMGWIA